MKDLAAAQLRAGQRIGGADCQEHADGGKHHRDQNRDPKGLHNGRIVKDLVVSLEVYADIALGQQQDLIGHNIGIVGKGCG